MLNTNWVVLDAHSTTFTISSSTSSGTTTTSVNPGGVSPNSPPISSTTSSSSMESSTGHLSSGSGHPTHVFSSLDHDNAKHDTTDDRSAGVLESPSLGEEGGEDRHDPRDTTSDENRGRDSSSRPPLERERRSTVTPASPQDPPPPRGQDNEDDNDWSWNGQLAIVSDKIMSYIIITLVSIIMLLLGYMTGSWIFCAYYHIGCCGQCGASSSSS